MNVSQYIRNILRSIILEDFRYQYDQETGGLTPPSDVIGTAKRALEAVNKNKLVSHGGNEGSGVQKAKTLAAGNPINHAQLKRMKAFFDKNLELVKQERQAGRDIYTSELVQKWELWGGDAGMRWANKEIKDTQQTNITSKKLRPKGTKTLMDPHNTRTHKANHFFTENIELNKPNIFRQTIYRIPNEEELRDVNKYNLTAEQIVKGFGYTLIGRGVASNENKNQILESIKLLCKLFPENHEYKEALTKASDIKVRF